MDIVTEAVTATASTGMVIVLPKEYPLIVLACALICAVCFLTGFMISLPRFTIFSKDFMKQFQEEHVSVFPGTVAFTGGDPDGGDGRYAQLLEYKEWVKFNNAMRVYTNFVEQLPMVLTHLMISGLFLPLITTVCAFVYVGARVIYGVMYWTKGGDARKIGAVMGSLPLYLLSIAAFVMAII